MTKGNGWIPRALYSRWYKRGQHQVKKLIASIPSRLEDRGAVAVEFAVIFPLLLLMLSGIFGVGVVMIQYMQLNFVVENAAKLEAAGGDGRAWATAQLAPSPVSFTANPSALCSGVPGAQVTGQWPVSLGLFNAVALTLSAQACALK